MSVKTFFEAESIAIVGATENKAAVGYAVLNNLTTAGYKGKIYPVNVQRDTVLGIKAYKNVTLIGSQVDLVIVCVPAKFVPPLVEECGKIGVKGMVIISAGFAEVGEEGLKMCDDMLKTAAKYNIRLVGPNCLGIIRPKVGINCSFAACTPKAGKVAFASQSGALCTAVLDWAKDQEVGFSYFVSIGSSIDVDYADLIDHWTTDDDVNSAFMYMEAIKQPAEFLAAARKFCLKKPLFILKSGKSDEGAKAAMSHTGSLAGNDGVYDAVFEKVGCIRLNSITELWDCMHCLAQQNLPKRNHLCIITNAGGPGVISTDAMSNYGGTLATLSADTMEKLNALLPPQWSHGNPVDIIGDAKPEQYKKAAEICLADPNVDGAVVILTPQSMTDPLAAAQELIAANNSGKPILASWMGQSDVQAGVDVLERGGVPNFGTPERAVIAFCLCMRHQQIVERLTRERLPSTIKAEGAKEKAEALMKKVRGEGRHVMNEYEARQVMSYYGIEVGKNELAVSLDDAIGKSKKLGYPVVFKICSHDIMHKTDVGGVKINIKNDAEAKEAYETIMANAKKNKPQAVIQGILICPMNGKKYECIVGMNKDPLFGPVIVFGMGGVSVELYKDAAIALPPLDMNDAEDLCQKTKVYQLIKGYRGMPGSDVTALKALLCQFAQLIKELPDLTEVDINPLAIDQTGMIVLDAKIVLSE